MNILIVGGAGFVGANLAFKLKTETRFNITVLDNLVRRGSECNLIKFKRLGINFIHGDVRNREDILTLPPYDIVLDCAAQPSAVNYKNPAFDITNNTYGVLNLLEYCKLNKSGLIYWSTNKCYSGTVCNKPIIETKQHRFVFKEQLDFEGFNYKTGFSENLSIDGGDHSIYGMSKVMGDLMIQEYANAYGIPAICNRFSCLAGPNQWGKSEQGWVAWFIIANYFNLPVTVYGYNGHQVRDYLFIDDVYTLILKQCNSLHSYHGEVFNVGGGSNFTISIKEALNLLENTYNKMNITYIDNVRRADHAIYISDTRKVKKAFSWEPSITAENGFKQIWEWVDNNQSVLKSLYL
jgi:CDP-paratose 2-epimerase